MLYAYVSGVGSLKVNFTATMHITFSNKKLTQSHEFADNDSLVFSSEYIIKEPEINL